MKSALVGLALAVVAASALAGFPNASSQGGEVSVLVDFEDGTYLWADVVLPDDNRTALKATEIAVDGWGIPPMKITWYSFGALVEDIGDRIPRGDEWWHFYEWDVAAGGWVSATVGASDLILAAGDSIAWYLAVDDPVTFEGPLPVPRPDFRDVHTSFRGDLLNSGRAHGRIPGTVEVLWHTDVGVLEIDTTPVVAYGNVYVGTRNALVALDARTGAQVWRNPAVRSLLSTPAVYNGELILGGTDGKLHSVDTATGSEMWSLDLEPGASSTGIASSPALFDGRAYVGTFNETAGGRGQVVAVNLNNGTIAWTYGTGSVHMSAPAIADGSLYVGIMGTYDGGVGYDPPFGLLSLALNGSFRWFFATNGSVASSPAVVDDLVVFTAKDGFLYGVHAGGSLAWSRAIGTSTSGPAFRADRLYAAAGTLDGPGTIRGFDLAGTELWEADPGGAIQTSLVTDGTLVCGSTNIAEGRIVCLSASDGSLAWSYTPEPTQYILGSPVVAGGVMYAPSDNGHLYAFGTNAAPASSDLLLWVAAGGAVLAAVAGAVWLLWKRKGSHAQ